jgi:DNA polymerase-3 subunit epsilon
LGTAHNHEELDDIARTEDFEFDLDIYKVIKKALTGAYKTNVVKLFSTQQAAIPFDAME